MTYSLITVCPVCDGALNVTRLQCSTCHTTIENKFSMSNLAKLSKEQMKFVEVFLISRGNIKEVEKALGISYPTVRSKLNEIVHLLTGENSEDISTSTDKSMKTEVITMLEKGEITSEEAINLLKEY